MPAHLDAPAPGTPVDPLCFQLRGWLWLDSPVAQSSIATLEVYSADTHTLLGSTATLYARPDVTAALSLPTSALTGFEFFAHHSAATPATFGAPLEVRLHARLRDGSLTAPLATATVPTIARDYRQNHFGILLDQRTTAIQRRANIFAEGPSLAEGSGEVAHLLRRHLGPPPCRVIDVGCGLGSYGRSLLADGYDWMGAEVDDADCAELARLGLPHRHVDGRTLPFADASFDAALCLEVLEHLADPAAVLAEIRRVAPRQLLVSVPNCELLGYLWDHLATPWHMLEADHKNFYTRHSLGALLRPFYSRVELGFHTPYPLRTVEGTPLHYHLFAIATNP
ncbi:MAG: class I SAM-dependent methyltransferase [Verrucomicrobia bacterium]|nr:class I SAM-dependent methyltransferase [Verrucomicrobiota bacterium]